MAASPNRVCWDACTWIALIQKEKVQDKNGTIEDRERLCKTVFNQAEKPRGGILIVSSAFCLVEVCKHPDVKGDVSKLDDFFERESVMLVTVDRQIGYLARALMSGRYAGLKPADATHIATALFSEAVALHTFDRTLLDLSGKIPRPNGGSLEICKPSIPSEKGPLEKLADKSSGR